MKEDKRISILKSILSVAWADGDFEDREKALMEEILAAFGADHTEQSERVLDTDGADTPDLSTVLTTEDERYYCYQQAAKMSYADGVLVPAEREILDSLRKSLKLSEEAAKQAEETAREIMVTPPGPPPKYRCQTPSLLTFR